MSGWVLVTGAARRIGRDIALELARSGYDIVLHYNTSQDDAIKTANDIRKLGREVALLQLDLADLPLVKKTIPVLTKEISSLVGLINNAALFVPDDLDSKKRHKKINVDAPKILSEAFCRNTKSGAIINILDTNSTAPEFSHYNKTKKALAKLTLQHAARFAGRVRVNGVALGPVLRAPRQSEEHFRKLVAATGSKKNALPTDVAWTVRFLVDNPSLTGSILNVGGGTPSSAVNRKKV